MTSLAPRFDWLVEAPAELPRETLAAASERGLSPRLMRALARRGAWSAAELIALVDNPTGALHDPMLLPDAGRFRERLRRAVSAGERVLVFGDFDADGLTGLAILTLAMRRLGLDAEPYVPSRLDEGHGLSLAAVERARADTRTVIVTVDCGTTSVAEVAAARAVGIDVLISDHHAIPRVLPNAAALVNAHLPGSVYPDSRLSGAGIAFKLAQALLADEPLGPDYALELVDLAAVGSVADMVPIAGENRAILRLGLERLATGARPGLAALLRAAGVDPSRVDAETIGYAVAPRINAVGRVGDALAAAQLLLAEDPAEVERLAAELETANVRRRELLAAALLEARAAVLAEPVSGPLVLSGAWPVGVVGLVAGRLADELARPTVVFSTLVDPWRGSARSAGGFDLAQAFADCGDLFERFGGHPAAAGCHMVAERYDAFRERFTALAPAFASPPARRPLRLDLVLRAESVDYVLLRELAPLEAGGEPPPMVGIAGFVVARARAASGGHTQLTLRRGNEVLDGICFGRSDLVDVLTEGQVVDVVARLSSRTFGGYESLQLDIRDVAPEGWLSGVRRRSGASAQAGTLNPPATPDSAADPATVGASAS
jgi:single-stranded-DNA-specific exonuclease